MKQTIRDASPKNYFCDPHTNYQPTRKSRYPMPAYIAYSRCSTEEQGRKGHSHEYQAEGIRRSGAVKTANLQEAGYYSDTVSGTRFDNRASGLDAAFTLCDRNRGAVDYLFVYRWDRLGRDVSDCFQCIKKFRAIGVEVNCPDEWIDFRDPSYPLILSVKFGMAQSESMRISDRTRDGIHQANIQGIWTGAAPAGYRKGLPTNVGGKERRVCEVVPEVADLISKCFEEYANGKTKAELFSKYGKAIGVAKSQFNRMLHNPFYCGLIYIKPYRAEAARMVEGVHPAIISRELFDRCQAILDTSEHHTKGKTWGAAKSGQLGFYLKGVLKGSNGRNMTAYTSKGNGGKFSYYASQGIKPAEIIPAAKAHYAISQALRAFVIDADTYDELRAELNRQLIEQTTEAKRRGDAAKRGLEQVKQRLDRVTADYADGLINADEYRQLKQGFELKSLEYGAELIEAERQAGATNETVEQAIELLRSIDVVFSASTDEYKKELLKAIFPEGFEIDPNTLKVRTEYINEHILSICSKSMVYAAIEMKNGATDNSRPVKGGQGAGFRTDLQLLNALFAA